MIIIIFMFVNQKGRGGKASSWISLIMIEVMHLFISVQLLSRV